jgi:hypothetical protein
MELVREDIIHYAVRKYLRDAGWDLVAGQYPNGSDDELSPLNIVDRTVSCDNSPDHRRHSSGKLVPDLVAYKNGTLLIIEMKATYSPSDEAKLLSIITDRRDDFLGALRILLASTRPALAGFLNELQLVPCLGMTADCSPRPERDDFGYFDVEGSGRVRVSGQLSLG